ncbi:hypothetical protein DQQ01_10185 [Blautia argi]|uniref:Uncharacterized protein n=1 Tax=Blautia argi TaxID=1912897 RepID=A0A2Z4UBR4_9FIRM|nr:hypothetical protein DQQ01_10185 [Blautia argi]
MFYSFCFLTLFHISIAISSISSLSSRISIKKKKKIPHSAGADGKEAVYEKKGDFISGALHTDKAEFGLFAGGRLLRSWRR